MTASIALGLLSVSACTVAFWAVLRLRRSVRLAAQDRELLQLSHWAIQASPDPISIVDQGYVYRRINDAYTRVHGVPEAEIVGRSVADLHGPEVFEAVLKPKLDRCLAGELVTYQQWFDFKRAGRRYVDVTYAPLRTRGKAPEGVIVIVRDITEQHLAQEALRESESRLRDMVDSLPAGAVYVRGSSIYFNQTTEELTGYGREELETLDDWFRVLYGEDAERMRSICGQGSSGDQSEAWITTKTGERRLLTHIAYEDDDSKVWLLNDVTEQRRKEEDLERTRALLLAAVEQSPGGIMVVDAPTGRIRLLNAASLGVHAPEIDESLPFPQNLIPTGWRFLVPDGRALEPRESPLARAITRGEVLRNVDLVVETAPGQRRRVVANAAPVKSSRGEVVAGVLLFADVTELERADAALRESEAKLRLALQSARMGTWAWSRDSALTWSEDIAQLFGTEGSHHARDFEAFLDIVHPEDREDVRAAIRDALHTDTDFEIEHRVVLPSGETRWVCGRGQIHRDSDGRAERMAGTIWDITQRKQAETERDELEARLRQSQKMEALGTLAGGIAHDFNNILMAIFGFGELVRAELPREGEAKQHLDQMLSAAQRASRLVRQILAFTRKNEHAMGPVQLGPIVKEATAMLRATLPATIEIRELVAPIEGVIMAEGSQIQQILLNLGTNAAHAMRRGGGALEIELAEAEVDEAMSRSLNRLPPGTYVKLAVRDTGHGIAPEIIERIFDPFFTTKAAGEGTGLGLSMVHGIVYRHGGAIRVESERGRGAAFELFFPKTDLAAIAAEQEAGRLVLGSGRVLFVDDEEPLVRLGQRQLQRLGYAVEALTSSEKALESLRRRPEGYDVMITDQTMPRRTGLELAREARRLRPDLPVVLTTGFSLDITSEDLSDKGVDVLVMKPYSIHELSTAMRRAREIRLARIGEAQRAAGETAPGEPRDDRS